MDRGNVARRALEGEMHYVDLYSRLEPEPSAADTGARTFLARCLLFRVRPPACAQYATSTIARFQLGARAQSSGRDLWKRPAPYLRRRQSACCASSSPSP